MKTPPNVPNFLILVTGGSFVFSGSGGGYDQASLSFSDRGHQIDDPHAGGSSISFETKGLARVDDGEVL